MYDVIVIGAGPAGSAAARECAERGLFTLCIEEHGTVGYPVQCAGLLSNTAFDECRVSRRPVLNTVSGARIISGLGSELLFDAKKIKACVVDRGALDFEMAQAAADAGAEFLTKTALYGIDGAVVHTRGIHGHRQFPYRLLIAADGPRSTVARLLKMKRSGIYLAGIQADMYCDRDPNLVEIHPDASPEFFGYAIPVGTGRVRVGLCGMTQVKERFLTFQKKFGGRCTHFVTGTIPLGVMPRTYGNRTLFVGDAAGFVKPTSGGGVYTGVRSALHAAAVASNACEQDRFDDAALAAYEQRWKDDFGHVLTMGLRFFHLRQQLKPADIDRLIRAMNDPSIVDAIIKYGDMDRPAPLLKTLVCNPSMIRCLGPLLVPGLKSFFTENL
jgi:digeranylgeranylglycerophospholipid reductase